MSIQRADSQNNQLDSEEQPVSEEELKSVRRLFTSLLLTVKNLSLYPNGHTICVNSIKQFYTQLAGFLHKYKTLKIEIEREQIVYKGKVISTGIPEEGSLHFTLFRDGIRWIEFTDGIEEMEIKDLLFIINRYSKLSAEPEGDITTTLWETHFSHIQYEVVESYWSGDLETDKFSDLVSGKSTFTMTKEPDWREKEYQGEPEIDLRKIRLTPEEEAALQEMIRMEEDADLTSYLDALLDSLLQHREEMDFRKILDALSAEFTLSLGRKDFVVTLKILQGLQYILDICRKELPWAVGLIENFFIRVSGAESLAPLTDTWEQTNPEDAPILKDIFMLLNPEVIQTLLALVSKSQSVPIRNMLLDLIVLLASQDTSSLEMVLKNANENLLERLVALIVKMNEGQALKYLLKLSHHPSGHIRYEAVKGILNMDTARVKDMLDFINDGEDSIRQLVLEQMGQTRDDLIEEFLISYIRKNKSGDIHADHMIRCFKALGKCGSSRSVPFLRETLLNWRFLGGRRKSILRRGAAVALCKLGISQADEIMERAGRSMFPNVREIVNKVRQELNEEADNNDR